MIGRRCTQMNADRGRGEAFNFGIADGEGHEMDAFVFIPIRVARRTRVS